MMCSLILLGIYALSVFSLAVTVRLNPDRLRRLHPFLWISVFSFVPAVALGREILLRSGLSPIIARVPAGPTAGVAALFIIAIIPVRRWVRKNILERTADAARQSLNELPRRVISIEAAENRRDISMEEATERKARIRRDLDRIAAIDALGRLFYLLLKIHILRMSLQAAGIVAISHWRYGSPPGVTLLSVLRWVGVDGMLIFVPFMVIIWSLYYLSYSRPTHRTPFATLQ